MVHSKVGAWWDGRFPDTQNKFLPRDVYRKKRTNPETTPSLQKQAEEEWKKLKSMWIHQADQREACCKGLCASASSIVSATESSTENNPTLEKIVRQGETLLENKLIVSKDKAGH